MRDTFRAKHLLGVSALFGLLFLRPQIAFAQQAGGAGPSEALQSAEQVDLATMATLLQQLKTEVQDLKVQLKELKFKQESAQVASEELRKELEQTKTQRLAPAGLASAAAGELVKSGTPPSEKSEADRITKLEEDQQLADAKITEQNQTKVESASKYRILLSGIVAVQYVR